MRKHYNLPGFGFFNKPFGNPVTVVVVQRAYGVIEDDRTFMGLPLLAQPRSLPLPRRNALLRLVCPRG